MAFDVPIPGTIKTNSIDTYRKAKLKMLKRDFKIRLTDEEIAHANTLTTEVKIDRFCLTMLNKYWG